MRDEKRDKMLILSLEHGKLSTRSKKKKKGGPVKKEMRANPVQEHADRICKFRDPCYSHPSHLKD
jgi:hypothetical protein